MPSSMGNRTKCTSDGETRMSFFLSSPSLGQGIFIGTTKQPPLPTPPTNNNNNHYPDIMNLAKRMQYRHSSVPLRAVISHGMFGLLCAYLGLLVGLSGVTRPGRNSQYYYSPAGGGCTSPASAAAQCPICPTCSDSDISDSSNSRGGKTFLNKPFPKSTSNFIIDYTTVDRMDLNDLLEVGVPMDATKRDAGDAIILYTNAKSLPSTGGGSTRLTPQQATANCDTVKLIFTEPQKKMGECIALLPQWESYHVHKFMRLPNEGGLDPKVPLRYVSRSADPRGRQSGIPDYKLNTVPSYKALTEYLGALDSTLEELRPILQKIATKKKSIVVSVVNYGQALLFENFLCNARAKGLDTSHLLLFATDEKTYHLAKKYDVTVYYNEIIFGNLPEDAARGYGDRIFSKMMMAKVYCVHLVISCGYNVLFQDVDMVWYRDPLPYLESKELSQWDMMFQDDGGRSNRYAPYSPNTGFYFVRYSGKTLFFLGMLLRSGDIIAKTGSHQAALTALLVEHVSWKGLRVKVWRYGKGNPFPGGVEYHEVKDYMKQLLKRNQNELDERMGKEMTYPDLPESEETAYIFHMSWTVNKNNKKLYLEQMGEWYLKEGCNDEGIACCLPTPNITCHYRDKPSLIDCSKSPPIDPGHRSFW